jgi:TonB-linked SusC/RagA family outer membrane protein
MGTSEGEGNFGKMTSILSYQPTIGKDYSDAEFVKLASNPWKDDNDNSIQNPAISARAEQIAKELRIFSGNAGLTYEIIKGLTFKSSNGMLYRTGRNTSYYTAESTTAKRSGAPSGTIATSEAGRFQTSNTLQYVWRKKNGHRTEFLAGQEWVRTWTRTLSIPLSNFPNDDLKLNDISVATPGVLSSSYNNDDKLLSFFARVYYNYRDRYMLTGTMRADGSSKFSDNNKWGYFPSVSAAWRMSEEEFIRNLGLFSDLKLRAGYGMAGNNRISSYQSLALWSSLQAPSGSGTTPGYYPTSIPNKDLKWEANKTFNVGLDMGFFDQRLVIAPEFYINRSSDLLLDAKLPLSSGNSSMIRNVGKTENRGIDISVTTVNISTRNFQWSTTLNVSHNKNKILALADEDSYFWSSNWQKDGPSDYLVAVGKPIGLMYGYKTVGLYTVDDFLLDENGQFLLDSKGKYQLKPGVARIQNKDVEPGFWKYKDNGGETDADGNPVITEDDKQVIGNANPKFYGGITNNFSYKGFDLSIFLNFSYGNDIFNATKFYNSLIAQANRTGLAMFDSSHRWITVGSDGQTITDPTVLAAVNKGKTVAQINNLQNGDKSTIHSWAIEDGSFLRINNITLGYTLPTKLTRKVRLSTVRFYVTANNLYTWTKYTGFDPEVSTRNTSGLTPGVDWSSYPRSRSFVFGLNVGI